jgi:succinoglycan biosynthesis protein ExoW
LIVLQYDKTWCYLSATPLSANVTVIIPFFQREPGILGRALESVLNQTVGTDRIRVIVVDDGSPISADDEIADFVTRFPTLRVQVLRQENAGPNTARNTALDHVSSCTDLVAFLDSDDFWSIDHLERAHKALSHSSRSNAYFSNLRHLDADGPAEFERAQRIVVNQHPVIFDDDDTFRDYVGDMSDQVMRANTIFMPTLVISRPLFNVRFDDGFRHGGGDYIYWLKLITCGARFCFSTKTEVECGRGINMWYSNGWGTDGYLKRLAGETEFRSRAIELYLTNPMTITFVKLQLDGLRQAVILDTIHRARNGKSLRLAELIHYRNRYGLGPRSVVSALTSKFRSK